MRGGATRCCSRVVPRESRPWWAKGTASSAGCKGRRSTRAAASRTSRGQSRWPSPADANGDGTAGVAAAAVRRGNSRGASRPRTCAEWIAARKGFGQAFLYKTKRREWGQLVGSSRCGFQRCPSHGKFTVFGPKSFCGGGGMLLNYSQICHPGGGVENAFPLPVHNTPTRGGAILKKESD